MNGAEVIGGVYPWMTRFDSVWETGKKDMKSPRNGDPVRFPGLEAEFPPERREAKRKWSTKNRVMLGKRELTPAEWSSIEEMGRGGTRWDSKG